MTKVRALFTLLFQTIHNGIAALHWQEYQRGRFTVPWLLNRIISFVAGLPAAFICAAACWILVDVSVPLAAVGTDLHLTAILAASWPSFYAFIDKIDQCILAPMLFHRTELVLAFNVLIVSHAVGDQFRQLIAIGQQRVLLVLMVRFVLALPFCISAAALLVLNYPQLDRFDVGACNSAISDLGGWHF
jgi:hypothetical protein